jgi:hypothetical protein
MSLVGAVTVPSPASAATGDVIVADNFGTLWSVNPRSGHKQLISNNAKSARAHGQSLFGDVFGVAEESDGNYIVIDRHGTNDTPNPQPSRVIRVNARTGAQSLVVASPQMHYGLTAVAIAPDHEIYFGDEAIPDPMFNAGGVFAANPKNGSLRVVSTNSKSARAHGEHHIEAPLGLAFAPNGQLWVLTDNGGDDNAPNTPNDYLGSILKVDTRTGRQTLFTSNYISRKHHGASLFSDPRAFVRASNGDFYIVDDAAINNAAFSANDTKVIKVDHRTGAQTLVSDNARSQHAHGKALFNRPYGIAITRTGELVVGDGQRLLGVDPRTGRQSLIASGLGNAIGVILRR